MSFKPPEEEEFHPAPDSAITIVRLKRAHGYVDDALGAAESCQEDNLIEPRYLGPTAVELMDIAHEIRGLISTLRERLGNKGHGVD